MLALEEGGMSSPGQVFLPSLLLIMASSPADSLSESLNIHLLDRGRTGHLAISMSIGDVV